MWCQSWFKKYCCLSHVSASRKTYCHVFIPFKQPVGNTLGEEGTLRSTINDCHQPVTRVPCKSPSSFTPALRRHSQTDLFTTIAIQHCTRDLLQYTRVRKENGKAIIVNEDLKLSWVLHKIIVYLENSNDSGTQLLILTKNLGPIFFWMNS